MMVTFVSQCEKNSLKKTRRVLDAFANRIGDNTWQTVITQEGLGAVKKLLRKTASKSTAVSCFWIRSRSRSELVWVVGNRERFNEEGVVPVNRTRKNLLNSDIENDWKYLPLIKSLTAMSALFHDWGKASKLFQEKLNPNSKNKFKGDPIRHEWVSVLLFNALVNVKDDRAWLSDVIKGNFSEEELKRSAQKQKIAPLAQLPDAAKLLVWLIVSHHRLPNFSYSQKKTRKEWLGVESESLEAMLKRITQEWGYENRQDAQEYKKRVTNCFEFPNGLLTESNEWLANVKRWANNLMNNLPLLESAMQDGSYRLVLHHARLCLMLGDHFYSSQAAAKQWKNSTGLFANTDRETGDFKQKLDEHLVGVAKNALNTAHLLPAFEKEPPIAMNVQALRKLSPIAFKWQDKAVKKITEWKNKQDKRAVGFFAVNMASTGCGKTFANAKVIQALSINGNTLRYILALGLRTLTLQTGDEYRDRIGLTNDQLAVLIGSRAVAELHNEKHQHQLVEKNALTEEVLGSESKQALLDEFIDYDCELPEGGLSTVLTCDKDKQFLYAPVLACTIDHIMAATETKRGGRYILPSLRLMSSDLVIDEIDDFTGDDLIAIGRLIYLVGMLGRKVMVSSATIPPDLAKGYFNAYKKGWQIFSLSRDEAKAEVGCAWIDEFNSAVHSIKVADSATALIGYEQHHDHFIDKRVAKLEKQVAKRKAEIIVCPLLGEEASIEENKETKYFSIIKQAILTKHQQHHSTDDKTGINVSFGVVRVANISPCIALTQYLLEEEYPEKTQVKVMAYHSKQVLLLRHEQEKHLDAVLKRKEKKGKAQQAFSDPVIRKHLELSNTENLIFILVATPVEEVGRDHDFDWAIVEPSSYRSIVQLAGRVCRHRDEVAEQENIGLMQYNLKAFKSDDKRGEYYFIKPGYEDSLETPLPFHDISKLINEEKISANLNAIPRIKKLPQSEQQFLAALEHKVTANDLANFNGVGASTLQSYLTETWYLTALPQVLTPFRRSEASINLFLFYNADENRCYFTQKEETGKLLLDENNQAINREGILNIAHVLLSEKSRKNLWLERDYQSLISEYKSEPWLITEKRVSLRYGEINFVERENVQYEYNDQFGLVVVKKT
jgi:CRISPR-associated endonuclease/helicase Cas3